MGRRNNSQVEVLSGLAPGERVIVSAYAAFGKARRVQISSLSGAYARTGCRPGA